MERKFLEMLKRKLRKKRAIVEATRQVRSTLVLLHRRCCRVQASVRWIQAEFSLPKPPVPIHLHHQQHRKQEPRMLQAVGVSCLLCVGLRPRSRRFFSRTPTYIGGGGLEHPGWGGGTSSGVSIGIPMGATAVLKQMSPLVRLVIQVVPVLEQQLKDVQADLQSQERHAKELSNEVRTHRTKIHCSSSIAAFAQFPFL